MKGKGSHGYICNMYNLVIFSEENSNSQVQYKMLRDNYIGHKSTSD